MSNGRMPGVVHKIIPPGVNDPAITPCGVAYHVAVSKALSLFGYFAHRSGGIESHFYVRFDGTIEQYRSIFYQADAQAAGNSFSRGGKLLGFVSVETAGLGPGRWTAAQLDACARIAVWVASQADFPLEQAPAWDKPGLGYHCLFPEWNPDGHSCPGPRRVRQFHDELLPAIRAAAQPEGDDEMNVMELMHHKLNAEGLTVAAALRDGTQANRRLDDLEKKLDDLKATVQEAIAAGK